MMTMTTMTMKMATPCCISQILRSQISFKWKVGGNGDEDEEDDGDDDDGEESNDDP